MDTQKRIQTLLDERGWSKYRLAKECGLSESTISHLFKRNTIPKTSTLEIICSAFNITLAQFFAEGEVVELTPELKEVFNNWVNLTIEQKEVVLQTMKAFNKN